MVKNDLIERYVYAVTKYMKADLKRVRLRRPEWPVLYRLPLDTEFCGLRRPD